MYTAAESVVSVLCLAVVSLLGYCFISWLTRLRSKKLLPGPRDWGTSCEILKASWNDTMLGLIWKWAKKYGDVTFVYILGKPTLFLNSAEVTRQLLASEKYKFLVADRIKLVTTRIIKFNDKDLIFTKFDDTMRKKRRLFYKMIGLYGDGVDRFENVVWGEMERMFKEIDKSEGDDIDMTKTLARSLKIILYILAKGELPPDPEMPDILENYDLVANKLSSLDVEFVLYNLPFLTYLPGKYKNLVSELTAAKEKADDLIYYDPKKTYVPGQPRGMTDLLMDHHHKPDSEWLENDDEQILAFITSMFMAAHLTSRSLLTGIFLCLLNYPAVTEKIREEIDRIIGDQRPKIEHKSSMPYTEATILEALRLVTPIPISGGRKALADIEFNGMFIPKKTVIFMNNWYYLHDENVWEDPWSFKPERFLDREGQLLPADHQRRKDLIVFGTGVRACPGDVFSRSRVFLIITSILQRYDILPPANGKLPPADFQFHNIQGLISQLSPYNCRIIHRQ